MLHYHEGEFYKEHHDYDGKHLEEPSGPRVFTFFLYLNDVEEVRRLTGGKGVEAAVDYAGHGETLQAAIDSLAVSGRAVAIGVGHGEAKISAVQLLMNEIIVTGSRHSTRAEFIETMELMARGTIKPVVGERVPFTEVETLFEKLAHEKLLGRGALTYD